MCVRCCHVFVSNCVQLKSSLFKKVSLTSHIPLSMYLKSVYIYTNYILVHNTMRTYSERRLRLNPRLHLVPPSWINTLIPGQFPYAMSWDGNTQYSEAPYPTLQISQDALKINLRKFIQKTLKS